MPRRVYVPAGNRQCQFDECGRSGVSALDEIFAKLRKPADVRIEPAPELAYGGPAKHRMFREPSGNRIELVHS